MRIETITYGRMNFVSWDIGGSCPRGSYRATWPYFNVAKAIVAVVETHPDRLVEHIEELNARVLKEDQRDRRRYYESWTVEDKKGLAPTLSDELIMKDLPVLVLVNITSPGVSIG